MNSSSLSALNAGVVRVGDFHINRLGFGAMRITGPGVWGEPDNIQAALAVLTRAVELDVNFIDTADAYGPAVSENLIARALYPYDGIIIATKGGNTRGGPGQWTPDGSPAHLRQALDASLQRLRVDRIDVYQLHAVDSKVPFEDSFGALLDLQKEGKIRHIGLSNIEPEHFLKAQEMGTFVSVQNHYNVLNREHEDVLQLCEENEIAFIPYFPMGGGKEGQADVTADSILRDLASKHQVTPQQIALAWLLAHSPVTLPIPGTSSIEHLEQNIAAANITLDDDDLLSLADLSNPS